MDCVARPSIAAERLLGNFMHALVVVALDLGGDCCESEPSGDQGPVLANRLHERDQRVIADRPKHQRIDDAAKPAGDAEQLRQVLINLIQNAVQAMQGRGEVTIKTGERMQRGASFVTIAISDRGPGIAPAARKSLFTPFFTTKEKGTGLGLAISARAVQEMGGRRWDTSSLIARLEPKPR